MTQESSDNVAASVRDRLLNLAHQQHEPFDLILVRYALERLLYRLGVSDWRQRFVVKGAMLFALWQDAPRRPTRDLDLLGYGRIDIETIETMVVDLCRLSVPEDGLQFREETIRGENIREQNAYHGVRVRFVAALAGALIPLQIDVGVGDVVTPAPQEALYPTLLPLPAPRILVYPMAAMVAEKFQAMIVLGMTNSRMKDYYDLWALAKSATFEGNPLADALRATFGRRQVPLPADTPLALSEAFVSNTIKAAQWMAFTAKNRLEANMDSLDNVVIVLRSFLLPPSQAAAQGLRFDYVWMPGGPWQQK